MLSQLDRFVINARFLELTDELSSFIDPEFDIVHDDLEREFAELRCQIVEL